MYMLAAKRVGAIRSRRFAESRVEQSNSDFVSLIRLAYREVNIALHLGDGI
jgi:hypothetical protein